jgi:ribulose-5-phosphate 4-epimerase/fuculose-1-phosphate aldolase
MTEADPVVLQLLREELVAWSRRGYERGLVAGVSGNNSLRVPATDLILIKATGGCQGDMDLTDTVLMTLDGEVLDPGRHGSITIGPDLRTAYFRTEYLEDCAKVATLAAGIRGTAPAKIPLADDTDQLAEVR